MTEVVTAPPPDAATGTGPRPPDAGRNRVRLKTFPLTYPDGAQPPAPDAGRGRESRRSRRAREREARNAQPENQTPQNEGDQNPPSQEGQRGKFFAKWIDSWRNRNGSDSKDVLQQVVNATVPAAEAPTIAPGAPTPEPATAVGPTVAPEAIVPGPPDGEASTAPSPADARTRRYTWLPSDGAPRGPLPGEPPTGVMPAVGAEASVSPVPDAPEATTAPEPSKGPEAKNRPPRLSKKLSTEARKGMRRALNAYRGKADVILSRIEAKQKAEIDARSKDPRYGEIVTKITERKGIDRTKMSKRQANRIRREANKQYHEELKILDKSLKKAIETSDTYKSTYDKLVGQGKVPTQEARKQAYDAAKVDVTDDFNGGVEYAAAVKAQEDAARGEAGKGESKLQNEVDGQKEGLYDQEMVRFNDGELGIFITGEDGAKFDFDKHKYDPRKNTHGAALITDGFDNDYCLISDDKGLHLIAEDDKGDPVVIDFGKTNPALSPIQFGKTWEVAGIKIDVRGIVLRYNHTSDTLGRDTHMDNPFKAYENVLTEKLPLGETRSTVEGLSSFRKEMIKDPRYMEILGEVAKRKNEAQAASGFAYRRINYEDTASLTARQIDTMKEDAEKQYRQEIAQLKTDLDDQTRRDPRFTAAVDKAIYIDGATDTDAVRQQAFDSLRPVKEQEYRDQLATANEAVATAPEASASTTDYEEIARTMDAGRRDEIQHDPDFVNNFLPGELRGVDPKDMGAVLEIAIGKYEDRAQKQKARLEQRARSSPIYDQVRAEMISKDGVPDILDAEDFDKQAVAETVKRLIRAEAAAARTRRERSAPEIRIDARAGYEASGNAQVDAIMQTLAVYDAQLAAGKLKPKEYLRITAPLRNALTGPQLVGAEALTSAEASAEETPATAEALIGTLNLDPQESQGLVEAANEDSRGWNEFSAQLNDMAKGFIDAAARNGRNLPMAQATAMALQFMRDSENPGRADGAEGSGSTEKFGVFISLLLGLLKIGAATAYETAKAVNK